MPYRVAPREPGSATGAQCARALQERGFTFLELALVIFLMALVIAVALLAIHIGLRLAMQSHESFVAAKGIVEYELESLRSVSYSDATLNLGTHTAPTDFTTPVLELEMPVDHLRGATAQYTVSLEGGDPDLKRVVMVVTWTDANERSRLLRATTVIGRQGVTN